MELCTKLKDLFVCCLASSAEILPVRFDTGYENPVEESQIKY
jgi:hypothetical protein